MARGNSHLFYHVSYHTIKTDVCLTVLDPHQFAHQREPIEGGSEHCSQYAASPCGKLPAGAASAKTNKLFDFMWFHIAYPELKGHQGTSSSC